MFTHFVKIEWNSILKKRRNWHNWIFKLLQTPFDWACSWTVSDSASYRSRPPPQHKLKQNSTFKHKHFEILDLETSVYNLCIHAAPFWFFASRIHKFGFSLRNASIWKSAKHLKKTRKNKYSFKLQQNVENVVQEIQENGGTATSYICDVSKIEEIKSVADKVRREVGDVDVLVNNAGILHGASFLTLTDAEIKRTIDINLLAYFWVRFYWCMCENVVAVVVDFVHMM
jgi:hypothetical protein